MTTENVTILFTDMVGSTALASSLAASAADELRRGHFSILRRAVSESGGTEVKNLGDGLMVVFGSASAALSCAVAMQQGVERDNRDREQTVGLRVGLSGGEVSKEDDDYFGDPVIEAARLCARCEGEEVLAADVVRLMAGRRSHQECRALGELTLKGLPDPVAAVEVLWEPLDGADSGSDVPLPERLGVRPAVGVVGRETETSTMLDAFKRVVAGEGREVILVSGEAGSGEDDPGRRLGARRVRRRCVRLVRALRGGSRDPLSALQLRRSAITSRTLLRNGSSRMSTRTARSWRGWFPRWRAGSGICHRRKRPMRTPNGSCSSAPWSVCWSGVAISAGRGRAR